MTRLPRPMAWILLWGGAALPITACSGPSPGDADGMRRGASSVGSEGAGSRARESDAPVRVPFLTRDTEGRPLGGVTIQLGLEGKPKSGSGELNSDAYGNYELALVPGRYELVAWVDGFVNVQRSFEVDRELHRPLELVFEEGFSIRGRLVDCRGLGVPLQEICAFPSERNGDRFWESWSWGVTDRDGFFELTGLSGAPVDLMLQDESGHATPELMCESTEIDPGGEEVLMQLAPDGRVRALFVDAHTGEAIHLLERGPGRWLEDNSGLLFGTGRIHHVHVLGYEPTELDLTAPSDPSAMEVTLALEPLGLGGDLVVVAVDNEGAALSDLEVYASNIWSARIPAPSRSSERGGLALRGLSTHSFELVLESPGFKSAKIRVDWVQGEDRVARVPMERHWPVEIGFRDAGGHPVRMVEVSARGDLRACGLLEWIGRGIPLAHHHATSLGGPWPSRFSKHGPLGTAVFPAPGEYVLRTRLGQGDWREHRVWVDGDTGPLTLIP